jgi:hypothetical protein
VSFAPEIVVMQAVFKALFALFVLLAWASNRKVLAVAFLVVAAMPAFLMMATRVPSGSLMGAALLWMGEFPLFALVLCLALPLGFSAGLWAVVPGALAGAALCLWPQLSRPLVDFQLAQLQQIASQMGGVSDVPSRGQLWGYIGQQAGFSAASSYLAAAFALLWVGRKNGTGRIALAHGISSLSRLGFPEWPVWGVAAGLALILVPRQEAFYVAASLGLFCGAFYLVRGMSLWSAISVVRMQGNLLWFLALLGTALIFPKLFLVATAALGLLDQWFLLRERVNSSIGDNP